MDIKNYKKNSDPLSTSYKKMYNIYVIMKKIPVENCIHTHTRKCKNRPVSTEYKKKQTKCSA